MHCAVCGAPLERQRAHCVICGYAQKPGAEKPWDRAVEAALYEDLQKALEAEESLLGATRGRIAGSWRGRVAFHPQALLSPFVNLGLTARRLLLQHVHQGTGQAVTDRAAEFPLEDVLAMRVSDADPLEPGRTARLELLFRQGDTFRLRAGGRLAEGAREMVEVWQTLSGTAQAAASPPEETCPHCGQAFDRPYRFCPFCGKELGDA